MGSRFSLFCTLHTSCYTLLSLVARRNMRLPLRLRAFTLSPRCVLYAPTRLRTAGWAFELRAHKWQMANNGVGYI